MSKRLTSFPVVVRRHKPNHADGTAEKVQAYPSRFNRAPPGQARAGISGDGGSPSCRGTGPGAVEARRREERNAKARLGRGYHQAAAAFAGPLSGIRDSV
jgi:hypothetical protein